MGPIAVALSGGVDSSVAAALLLERGSTLTGVTLRLLPGPGDDGDLSACGKGAVERARAVCERLGIPHRIIDAGPEFDERVLRHAWAEYDRGRTPNPCLVCNRQIKFGLLLAWAERSGHGLLATGHYARVDDGPADGPALLRGADRGKDQSYFLAGLTRDQLARSLFPIGHLAKRQVRDLARALDLPTAGTEESQDACLTGADGRFAETLRTRFDAPARPGAFIDAAGRPLGRHSGLHRFTIGQRRGLPAGAARRWVQEIRPDDGSIVLTDRQEDLLTTRLTAGGATWIAEPPAAGDRSCEIQVRYRSRPEPAVIEGLAGQQVTVAFERPLRAVTPGQAAVFYRGQRVLGMGWIETTG